MSKRLFIDCDDTLVKYQDSSNQTQHPYGYYMGTPWNPNEPLIDAIRQFRKDNPHSLIVVWSGGGREYAQLWIDRLLPGLGIVGLGKSREVAETMIRAQDIVVDDVVDFPCVASVYEPDEWPISTTT